YRLGGYRAAVDDHDVALVGQHPPNRFAFGNVQPATQRNDFGAHAKSPQSKVPRKLSVAGPVMVMCPSSPQAISNAPPGKATVTSLCTRPRRIAATAVAQAPVPQARVSPAPRSHTRRRMFASFSTVATLTLTRPGKIGSA